MPIATDLQVQTYVDSRIRPRMEQIRALVNALHDDKAAIDDIYAASAQVTPTWNDSRTDGPPHLLSVNDILAYNSYITALIPNIENAADYPSVIKACVRPLGSAI